MRFTRSLIFASTLLLSAWLPSALSAAFADSPAAQGTAQAEHFVNSFEDFMSHTRAHVGRVVALGIYLRKTHPHAFEDVDPDLLRSFLELHDQAKLNPALSRGRSETFARSLYRQYGKNFNQLSEQEKSDARALVAQLNRVDSRVGLAFFRDHGLLEKDGTPSAIARKFLLIEKVSDQVDRGLSPISPEEFHKAMQPASQWMKDPSEKRLALFLERPGVYEQVTRGLSYKAYRSRESCIELLLVRQLTQ